MILQFHHPPLKKLVPLLLLSLLLLASSSYAEKSTKDEDKTTLKVYIAQIRDEYEKFPDKGKFVTGAVIGFGASKMVVKSAVTFVKVAGAAFVA